MEAKTTAAKAKLEKKADQVPVATTEKGKYYPAVKLKVDKFARADDGHICMVQLLRADGQKVLWDEKA